MKSSLMYDRKKGIPTQQLEITFILNAETTAESYLLPPREKFHLRATMKTV